MGGFKTPHGLGDLDRGKDIKCRGAQERREASFDSEVVDFEEDILQFSAFNFDHRTGD